MQSRIRVLGHALHPILVDFPVVLFPLLVGLDVLTRLGSPALWAAGGWLCLVGGGMALLAIVTGTIDLARIPDTSRAHAVARWHFVLGCAVLVLYGAGLWLRLPLGAASTNMEGLAIAVDVAGLVLVVVQGWLGGELMERHHVGIRSPGEGADPTPLKGGQP